jgi:outer membrane protein
MNWMTWLLLLSLAIPLCPGHSQTTASQDSVIRHGTLHNCVEYALAHQPLVQQAHLDEEITDRLIGIQLADWFPQLNFSFDAQHYYKLPTVVFQGNPIASGSRNTSTGSFALTQTVFNRDVLLASSTADELRDQSRRRTAGTKIDVVVNVSKAFYATLLSQEQIELFSGDIIRLQQSQKDSYNQYKSGVVDKTDYERATIALNNVLVQRRQAEELLKARFASLKEQMGYPPSADLPIEYDSTAMESEAHLDTTQTIRYENRIEYQVLELQRSLQESKLSYARWGFLPSISAFGEYNLNYLNSTLSQLYLHDYPSSLVGVQLTWPIFQGGKRIDEIQEAKFELERSRYDIVSFENGANTEFVGAMGSYKSNLNNYQVAKDNLALARAVYQTLQLQYRTGVKTYLDVITAETDLRTAELNETDALYEVLSSKLDVQKALGTIQY